MTMSVVVPTWRRPEHLSRCLAGLEAQVRRADEVVVVARQEDTETWGVIERAEAGCLAIRSVAVTAPGMVPSLNVGLHAATGEVVVITDDDTVPHPDWLERMEAAFALDRRIGGVGGRDWLHEGDRVVDDARSVVGKVRWYGRVVGNHHLGAGQPRDVDVLKGANMAFRREAIRGVRIAELRGRDTQPHWEWDVCLPVKRAGWRLVYDPAIAVDHFRAPRLDEDQRTGRPISALANEVYNETYILLRHLPRLRAAVVLAYGLAVGTRLAPGLLVGVERRLRGERVGRRLVAAERARIEAVLALARRMA